MAKFLQMLSDVANFCQLFHSFRLFFWLIHLLVDPDPDCFLSCECQGQVDAIESHPIDVLLPLWPLPKGKSVSRRADILIVPQLFIGRQCKLGHGQ